MMTRDFQFEVVKRKLVSYVFSLFKGCRYGDATITHLHLFQTTTQGPVELMLNIIILAPFEASSTLQFHPHPFIQRPRMVKKLIAAYFHQKSSPFYTILHLLFPPTTSSSTSPSFPSHIQLPNPPLLAAPFPHSTEIQPSSSSSPGAVTQRNSQPWSFTRVVVVSSPSTTCAALCVRDSCACF